VRTLREIIKNEPETGFAPKRGKITDFKVNPHLLGSKRLLGAKPLQKGDVFRWRINGEQVGVEIFKSEPVD